MKEGRKKTHQQVANLLFSAHSLSYLVSVQFVNEQTKATTTTSVNSSRLAVRGILSL